MKTLTQALAAVGLAIAGPAAAHVVAVPDQAPAGSYSAVAFRVGHGCKGESATVSLRLAVPPQMLSARPQPKPGWTLKIETDGAADKPKVTAITWTGRLDDSQFDDFAVLFKLPAEAGPLYLPAVQTCETGESAWTQIPAEPDMTGLERPAPVLTVLPAAAGPVHNH